MSYFSSRCNSSPICVCVCVGHRHLAPLTGFQMLERSSTGLISLFILRKRLYLASQTLYDTHNITPIFMSSICALSSLSSCLTFPISCLMSALISSPSPQSCPHFMLQTARSLYPGTTFLPSFLHFLFFFHQNLLLSVTVLSSSLPPSVSLG